MTAMEDILAGEIIAQIMPNAVAVPQPSDNTKIFDKTTGEELGSKDFRRATRENLSAFKGHNPTPEQKAHNRLIRLQRFGHLHFDIVCALRNKERTMTSDEWRLHKIELTGRLVEEDDYKVVPVGTKVATPEGKQFFNHGNLGWFDPEIDDSVLGQGWMLARKYPYTVVEELPKWVDDAA